MKKIILIFLPLFLLSSCDFLNSLGDDSNTSKDDNTQKENAKMSKEEWTSYFTNYGKSGELDSQTCLYYESTEYTDEFPEGCYLRGAASTIFNSDTKFFIKGYEDNIHGYTYEYNKEDAYKGVYEIDSSKDENGFYSSRYYAGYDSVVDYYLESEHYFIGKALTMDYDSIEYDKETNTYIGFYPSRRNDLQFAKYVFKNGKLIEFWDMYVSDLETKTPNRYDKFVLSECTYSYSLPSFLFKEHTLTLDPDGGSVSNTKVKVKSGLLCEVPIPTKEGYRFDEWYCGEYDEHYNDTTKNYSEDNSKYLMVYGNDTDATLKAHYYKIDS